MIKKLLIFILSLVFAIGCSFALLSPSETPSPSETSFTDIQLDNGENTIGPNSSKYLGIWGSGSSARGYINNDMEGNISYESYPSSSSLKITCKNGKIVRISSSHNYNSDYWIGNIDSVKITYGTDSASSSIEGSFTATCKSISQPTKKLEETNIDYQTIKQKSAWKGPFSLTTDKPDIKATEVQDKLKAQKDIDNQPSFLDVVYLQLDLISNLSNSLINTKPNFDFSKLFKITSDTGYNFTGYNIWLSKFGKYSTKKDFVDAMSGAISLKDVGVAQDVINGLYDCANNNNCSEVIHFKHDILDTYDPYSLSDIQDILYKKSNNILDGAISYYNYLSGACSDISSFSSIQDTFLRKQTQNICDEILKQNIDDTNQNDLDNYNLGYGLGQRVKNLTTLKTNFNSLGTGVNLLGIYNSYHELTNLNVGLRKISNIKKATEESSDTGQYGAIRKIFENDEKNVLKKAMGEKKIFQINTIIKGISTGTTLHSNIIGNNNLNIIKDVKVNGENIGQFVGSFNGVSYSITDILKVKNINITSYISIGNDVYNSSNYKVLSINGSNYCKIGYNRNTKSLYIKKNFRKFAGRRWLSKIYLKIYDYSTLLHTLDNINNSCLEEKRKIKCIKKKLKDDNLISFIVKNKGDYYKLNIKNCSHITSEIVCSALNKCKWDEDNNKCKDN